MSKGTSSLGRAVIQSVRSYSIETTASSTTFSSPSLRIKNPKMRNAILKGDWIDGPPSLRTKRARLAYNSPEGLKDVFPLAYEIILREKARHYSRAEEIKKEIEEIEGQDQPDKEETKQQKKAEYYKHIVRAELNDPEVQYNYRIKAVDLTQPVYRHLAEREWKSYDRLIMLQRIEQLHVIPDTMPTLNPRTAVSLQFPGVINKWVTPGEVLRNAVCTRAPILKVQEFEEIPDGSLYTVLIVDPDTPDIANDRYKTTLHWAVTNIPLSNTDHLVDLNNANELVPFLPPHPEKNGPMHRYCVWVFRQATQPGEIRPLEISNSENLGRDKFDIRKFASEYSLDPVGAHVWRCGYDQSTDEVREKFGLGPGVVFDKVRR